MEHTLSSKQVAKESSQRTLAQQADKHELYQSAVQSPETDIAFLTSTYEKLRGTQPLSLREDFCGTALLSTTWVQGDPQRTAIGVDLCKKTLAWADKHNRLPAGPDAAARVTLLNADVVTATTIPVDIVCAFNFSFCVFTTRDALRTYFKNAHANLKDTGLFVLDLVGGTEFCMAQEEQRDLDDREVTYLWEHESFNPITHDLVCHIHFEFPDESRIDKAFTYRWRLWTLPEVRELLLEAGFSSARVYWEREEECDEDEEVDMTPCAEDEYEPYAGTGEYDEVTEAENQATWVVYVVAEK